MTDTPELLTIAEAAARLGVSVPRLRRVLARPEFAGQVTAVTRETRTGTRTAQAIPFPFSFTLKAAFERETDEEKGGERERERERWTRSRSPVGDESGADRGLARVSDAELHLLRELVAEKDARISALERNVQALEANVQDLRRLLPPAPEASEKPKRRAWWPWGRKDAE